MSRTRNSAAAARIRRARPVSARTMARRARQQATDTLTATSNKKTREPETIGQARVWQRKYNRYRLAGLCDRDAVSAAWGHAEGFGALDDAGRNPCQACQPLVDKFDTPGPRGSKWRKCLTKLEYMTESELEAWLDAHAPED